MRLGSPKVYSAPAWTRTSEPLTAAWKVYLPLRSACTLTGTATALPAGMRTFSSAGTACAPAGLMMLMEASTAVLPVLVIISEAAVSSEAGTVRETGFQRRARAS